LRYEGGSDRGGGVVEGGGYLVSAPLIILSSYNENRFLFLLTDAGTSPGVFTRSLTLLSLPILTVFLSVNTILLDN
jgi:hypothetical protein